MEEAGWISRRPSQADRRGTEAILTELGARVVEEASPAHLALVRRLIFDVVGGDRAGAMSDAMDEIGRAARGETT
jgi:DNA-binding MarR family transcriptional regulator